MFRYNCEELKNLSLWDEAFVSPCRYDNPWDARRYLALLYLPRYLYSLKHDNLPLKQMWIHCRENDYLRRVWAAFGQPGGGLECQLNLGDKNADVELKQDFGVYCMRSYEWVKEPVHGIYHPWRQGVKDLYGQCRNIIKGMDIRGVEFQGEEDAQSFKILDDTFGAALHFSISLPPEKQVWELTISFALLRTYCEPPIRKMRIWGMAWRDVRDNDDPINPQSPDYSVAGRRYIMEPVVQDVLAPDTDFHLPDPQSLAEICGRVISQIKSRGPDCITRFQGLKGDPWKGQCCF
jgi:hypothetical protein